MGKKYVQVTVKGIVVKMYLADIRKIHRWEKKVKTAIPHFDSRPILRKPSQSTEVDETNYEQDMEEDSFFA